MTMTAYCRTLVAGFTVSMLAACGALQPAPRQADGCAAGFEAFERDTLYFGRAIPTGGRVSEAEWLRFLDDTITPAFPKGLTVLDAAGQWRGASGDVVREPSKLVVLLHPRDPAADAAVAHVIDAYRKTFLQEAVLQERQSVCVRF